MASIRKRGNRWQVQVRRQGFPLRSKSFVSKKDAEVWARQTERSVDQGDLPANLSVLSTITLGELVTRYRDEVTPRKRGANAETYALNKFLRHHICRKTLNLLLPSDFAEYRDERLAEVSSATLRRQFNPLHHMFEIARDEWNCPLRENPMDKVKFAVIDNRRERRLRQGELVALREAAAGSRNGLIWPIVIFALETGLRRGEILKADWRHVDLGRRCVSVLEAKNGRSRVIPLTDVAAGVLERIERRDGRLFPITANALKLTWQRLKARANIEDLHFHDLRHEAISRFAEYGLTIPEVASISGHRDPRMLMRYAHASWDRVHRLISASDAPLSQDDSRRPSVPRQRQESDLVVGE